MKEEKTKQEIFEQKYPAEKLVRNSLLCAEAIGYLKALMFLFSSRKRMGGNFNDNVNINNFIACVIMRY